MYIYIVLFHNFLSKPIGLDKKLWNKTETDYEIFMQKCFQYVPYRDSCAALQKYYR